MTALDIYKLINSLPPKELKMLNVMMATDSTKVIKIEQIIVEQRHTSGVVCPHCGCVENVSRNGHRKDGKQRYHCNNCGKYSVANTNSITSGTRKDLETWKAFIKCMVAGQSVRKSAEACEIHRNTAFIWRHKVLDALNKLSNQTVLEGIVEADETFFPISYKGNHKKSKFIMPRDPHKRGKAVRLRGLSKEQVCVPCAVDRSGRAYSKITNLGRVSTKDLHNIYDDRIMKNATICTDKMNSYVRFAHSNDLNLIQLKTGKSKKGIYNIQRINSYHSELKGFLRPFKGVSTKYLNNYLRWHNLINMKGNALQDKVDYLLRSSVSIVTNIKSHEISNRSVIPLVA